MQYHAFLKLPYNGPNRVKNIYPRNIFVDLETGRVVIS